VFFLFEYCVKYCVENRRKNCVINNTVYKYCVKQKECIKYALFDNIEKIKIIIISFSSCCVLTAEFYHNPCRVSFQVRRLPYQ